jgi:hypothetical protein
LLQVGAGERAPVALGDENVAGLEIGGRSDLRRNSGEALSHFAYVNNTVHRNLYRISLP